MKLLRFIFPLLSLLFHPLPAVTGQVALHEEFVNLDNWVPLTFPKISRHSSYEIRQTAIENYLVAQSSGSASAIRYIHEFDVYRFPDQSHRLFRLVTSPSVSFLYPGSKN